MGVLRAATVLTGFAALTLPLMPIQAALKRIHTRSARRFPHWYHRQVSRLLGLRLTVEGRFEPDRPVLIVANHTSWLDIVTLSAVAPVSFIAKKEVGSWPGVSTLARLQRTVFVDRERRAQVSDTANEIRTRLGAGDNLILFAEGTSTDGNRVIPFKSSLFGAVIAPSKKRPVQQTDIDNVVVQTLTLVYTHLHGIPLQRAERPLIGWFGDMEMKSHAWNLLKAGPVDAHIRISKALPLSSFANRKTLARHAEAEIRRNLIGILQGRGPEEPLEVFVPEFESATIIQSVQKPSGWV